jgi:hypothetical protein
MIVWAKKSLNAATSVNNFMVRVHESQACSFGQVRVSSITGGFGLKVLLVLAEPLPE